MDAGLIEQEIGVFNVNGVAIIANGLLSRDLDILRGAGKTECSPTQLTSLELSSAVWTKKVLAASADCAVLGGKIKLTGGTGCQTHWINSG